MLDADRYPNPNPDPFPKQKRNSLGAFVCSKIVRLRTQMRNRQPTAQASGRMQGGVGVSESVACNVQGVVERGFKNCKPAVNARQGFFLRGLNKRPEPVFPLSHAEEKGGKLGPVKACPFNQNIPASTLSRCGP